MRSLSLLRGNSVMVGISGIRGGVIASIHDPILDHKRDAGGALDVDRRIGSQHDEICAHALCDGAAGRGLALCHRPNLRSSTDRFEWREAAMFDEQCHLRMHFRQRVHVGIVTAIGQAGAIGSGVDQHAVRMRELGDLIRPTA